MDSFQPLRQSGLDSALCYRRFSHDFGALSFMFVSYEYCFGGGGKENSSHLPRARPLCESLGDKGLGLSPLPPRWSVNMIHPTPAFRAVAKQTKPIQVNLHHRQKVSVGALPPNKSGTLLNVYVSGTLRPALCLSLPTLMP